MRISKVEFLLLPLFFVIFPHIQPAFAQTPKLATESFYVPARDPGIELYVRNKRPEGATKFNPEKIVFKIAGLLEDFIGNSR